MVHFELQSQYDTVCVSITVDKKGADASRVWADGGAVLTVAPLPPLLINTL